ncbi:MFS transporter [Nocardia miyunensis]|uniref:MFS transporter n=1 Tax=Nocardia miyunensis TaxID=282684 RepID=UPI00082CBE3C|nr:MFS transporter [Nocardia miyunensis]
MTTAQRANHPWRVAVLAGMASYLDAGTLVTTGVAAGVLYAHALNLSGNAVGALIGLQTIMLAVGTLLGGRAGDRWGRKPVFTASLAFYTVGVAILTFATGVGMLYVGVVVSGLAMGADLPVSLAMINEEAPAGKKGRMVVFSEMLWVAGVAVVTVLTIFLSPLGALGARILFGHLAIIALVVLGLRTRMHESAEWITARRAAATAPADGTIQLGQLREIFRRPLLYAVLATGIYYTLWGIGSNTWGQFGSYLWTHLTGRSLGTWSTISLVAFPLGAITAALYLRVVDSGRRALWIAAGAVILPLPWIVLLVVGPTPMGFIVAVVVNALSFGLSGEPLYKVWTQELVPTLQRSTVQGLTFAMNRVGAAVFALVTPALVAVSPALLFGLCLVFSIAASLIAVLWIPRLNQAEPEDSGNVAAHSVA